MNLKSGYPFSIIKNGIPYNFPKLDHDIETDVVILGSGITGALVRYHLVKAGINCVTIDARTIGFGSTSASTSLLQYEIDLPLYKLTEMIGKKKAERSYQLCDKAINDLAAIAKELNIEDFEAKNSLYYAAYKKDVVWLKKEFKARKEAGFKVDYLNVAEVKKQYGIDCYGAILSHHGALTNAYMFTHNLLQYKAAEASYAIYDRSPVKDIKHKKDGVVLTTESDYTIKANKLIYATGYEVVNYIDEPIVDLLSTYAVVSEQYNERNFWKDEVLIWNTADPYLYIRTTADNRVLIGGRDEEFSDPAKRNKLLKKKTKQLTADANKLFPDLNFIPEFSWAGTFGSTKDGLPYIGSYSKKPNSYFALGFGGNGITFSLIAAQIIRDLIQDKENKDATLFAFER
ncbi:FAD-binding oxidoreductase [Flavobacterium arcticum]|uniref:FAD-binding oxidoreductase n=1 Tax=Flavobacterium arcticum TaxID=1784713 RepID=A0A345HEN8_9FLAO|nr:FAD-binding oxidoreductase [Flavobacterium arcticum]AXG75048.1 FAD-binding oxidoreductase [Flavobacterium arcticum]KAF2511169.1 FAD-binding oxidoreductase [Flavobacterium arcticum]